MQINIRTSFRIAVMSKHSPHSTDARLFWHDEVFPSVQHATLEPIKTAPRRSHRPTSGGSRNWGRGGHRKPARGKGVGLFQTKPRGVFFLPRRQEGPTGPYSPAGGLAETPGPRENPNEDPQFEVISVRLGNFF